MRGFTLTLFWVLTGLTVRGQDQGWQTIYSEGGSTIEYRIVVHHVRYLNDAGNGWMTKVFCRSTFPDKFVRVTLVADVAYPNDASYHGKTKAGATLFSGYCGTNNNGINDNSNDYETFTNVHLDNLKIGDRLIVKDGRQVGQ